MHPPSPRFQFPVATSSILPSPQPFFTENLLSYPLPTNSFFRNFTGDHHEPNYIHPYLVKLSSSSLSLCYPSSSANDTFIHQVFTSDLTISGLGDGHVVSEFSDLSVTVDFPNLRFYLARGCPYVTCSAAKATSLSISSVHEIVSVSSARGNSKHRIVLKNNQIWLIYASAPRKLEQHDTVISSGSFSGEIRFAVLPNSDAGNEIVLDRFSSCFPISGEAFFTNSFSVEYKWEKKGDGDLLMLAHPLHLNLISNSSDDSGVSVINSFRFRSIDGDLVGVVGDSWRMKVESVPITWHYTGGISEASLIEIISALLNDVANLDSSAISTSSSYFYGKMVARAARLALIAVEVSYLNAIPRVLKFLKDTLEPWLEGTFPANGFVYEPVWGGIISKQGAIDVDAEWGFGEYNNHYIHLGYFVYGIAVLALMDPVWGNKFKPQAYALLLSYMNLDPFDSAYTRLRCFDFYNLHSWCGGLRPSPDGRHQQSTGEAVNAYYSAALLGLAYGDIDLILVGSTLTSLEIQAVKTWWQVREEDEVYDSEFCKANKLVGVGWENKRETELWFTDREKLECRLGIQVIPLLPVTQLIFDDPVFVKELVDWCLPALEREGVDDLWRGFVYALEAVYDKEIAIEHVRSLKRFDDGNSLSNMLCWVHSRGPCR